MAGTSSSTRLKCAPLANLTSSFNFKFKIPSRGDRCTLQRPQLGKSRTHHYLLPSLPSTDSEIQVQSED
eukprot:3934877-Rhodomonas_salina.2